MFRKYPFLAFASVLLAAIAGFALAAPELTHHLLSLVGLNVGPHDMAGLSMAWGPVVLRLQKQRDTQKARIVELGAIAKTRDWSAQEEAEFEQLKSSLETLADVIDSAKQEEVNKARSAAGDGGFTFRAFSSHRTFDNSDADPTRGFSRQGGDFFVAVANAPYARRNGGVIDPRLQPLAAAPSSGGNEGSGADGGFAVPPAFANDMFTLALSEDSLLPLTDEMQLDGNSILIPKDENPPWSNVGPSASWQAEMSQATPTKPAISAMNLRLKKLMALVPISSELLADSGALPAYVKPKIINQVRWRSNEAILYGTGVGQPLGAYNTSSVVTVAKDSGQATNTLSVTNLTGMIARLPPGSFGRSVWMINNDVLPALFTLTLGNYPVYLPTGANVGGLQVNPYGMLLGRPIVVSQHANTFSAQGDVMLMDLSYYQTISKAGGVQFATSMHLYFDADAMAFRVTFRLDGQPKISAPITPAKGSKSLSPFVQLAAR